MFDRNKAEPAVFVGLIGALIALVVSFGFKLSPE